jgi:hypothetical protein
MVLVVAAAAGGCGAVTANDASIGGSGEDDAGTVGFGGDATAELDASTSCRVSSPLAFTAGTYRSAVMPSPACLDTDGGGEWDTFYDVCLGANKDPMSCAAFKADHAACAACIVTSYSADALGPILDYGQYVGGNVAGCIELSVPSDPTCPKAVQALSECELAACAANCPVTDLTSLSARNDCAVTADQSVCLSLYQMASRCRAGEADAGQGSACAIGPFKEFYDAVVPLFCGAVPSPGADAGARDAAASDLDGGHADGAREDAAIVEPLLDGAAYDAHGD